MLRSQRLRRKDQLIKTVNCQKKKMRIKLDPIKKKKPKMMTKRMRKIRINRKIKVEKIKKEKKIKDNQILGSFNF